jgi:hypothetical protein
MFGNSMIKSDIQDRLHTGIHDGSPNVAGYIGRPEAWRDWTEKWTAALRPINVYHAVDAQNLSGEFAGWTSTQVSDLVKILLPITGDRCDFNCRGFAGI